MTSHTHADGAFRYAVVGILQTAGKAVSMYPSRIPQRVRTALAPLSAYFHACPQGRHFCLLGWLLTTLLLSQGAANLKQLVRLMPRRLHDWSLLRLLRAGYWDAADLLTEMARSVLATLPPPTDGTLYLLADTTLRGKTGKQQPLAHYTRLNQQEPFVFGHSVLLVLAHWGRLRIPVGAVVLDPQRKGQQNIQLRRVLREFQPPSWCQKVIVVADAGFASKDNLRAVQRRGWFYVFCLPRTWKLADGTQLRDLARYLPKGRYHRVASYTPDRRRQDYWAFLRPARLTLLGDVTVLLSKKRRNQGPQQVKLIVTHLDGANAPTMLSVYARRWGVEVTFKELKSGLHLGQMQVTREPGRVVHALLLPVLAYLLLLRLYGRTLHPEQGASLFALKQRFAQEVAQEQIERTERKWRRKLEQARAAA
jgi:Transposase DDE domain